MRMFLTFLAAGLLSGCVTAPPNHWQGLDVDLSAAASPIDCGKFPFPTEVVGDSIVYDVTGANALEAYRVCSEANELIALEHSAQIGQLKLARKGLTEAGQAQRRIADMKEEMLADERRHHFFQSIGLYAVIIGMSLAL